MCWKSRRSLQRDDHLQATHSPDPTQPIIFPFLDNYIIHSPHRLGPQPHVAIPLLLEPTRQAERLLNGLSRAQDGDQQWRGIPIGSVGATL
ncbi:hypothetical protein MBR_07367, partial [Metarhizium brunneum ARSEF 3297]